MEGVFFFATWFSSLQQFSSFFAALPSTTKDKIHTSSPQLRNTCSASFLSLSFPASNHKSPEWQWRMAAHRVGGAREGDTNCCFSSRQPLNAPCWATIPPFKLPFPNMGDTQPICPLSKTSTSQCLTSPACSTECTSAASWILATHLEEATSILLPQDLLSKTENC